MMSHPVGNPFLFLSKRSSLWNLKFDSTIPVTPTSFPIIIPSNIVHKAVDTNATETATDVPISDKYKVIPALKQYEVDNVTHVSIVNLIYLLVITI